jgi:DNA-binding MarR family transcriptional regulator
MELKLTGTQMKILEEIKRKPCYLEQISKSINRSYKHTNKSIRKIKDEGYICEEIDRTDNRRKILFLTNKGKLFLAKIEARKSAITKIDSWLDKKFNEIGIDCERLFK